MKLQKKCLSCNNDYFINAGEERKRKNGSKTCSRLCDDNYQRRFRIEKICKICGDTFFVIPVYEKRYVTCAKADCREKNKCGVNNPNYKNGSYTENFGGRYTGKKYQEWRKKVLLRDGNFCKLCNKATDKPQVDHIKPYKWFKELRYDVSNGRVLCLGCHRSTFKENALYKKLYGREI